MSLEQIIITLGYLGILLLMTTNGIFALPSSQLIYILAGYFAYNGNFSVTFVIIIGALGHSIGNYILYEISRKKGMKYSLKFIKYMFQFQNPEREIKKFQIAFSKKSKTWLFIGKLANPSKIFIPIPAGIAKMNRFTYIIITYITSAIWASIFTLIGYYFGKSFENFGFIGIGLLITFLIVMTFFYKMMNSNEILKQLEDEEKLEKEKKEEILSKNNNIHNNINKIKNKKTK